MELTEKMVIIMAIIISALIGYQTGVNDTNKLFLSNGNYNCVLKQFP